MAALSIVGVGWTSQGQRRAEDLFQQPGLAQAGSCLQRRNLTGGATWLDVRSGTGLAGCSRLQLFLRKRGLARRGLNPPRFTAQPLGTDRIQAQLVRSVLALGRLGGVALAQGIK